MFDYFLFNQPWRYWLIKLYVYLPKKVQDKLLEALYPLDMPISFTGPEKDSRKKVSRCKQ